MANPQAPTQVFRHYFYDEASNFVYYTEEFPDELGTLIHIGGSDNPKPVSAATAFMQKYNQSTGYKLRSLADK